MYGSAAGVAALSAMWTNNGSFLDDGPSETATKPSASQVETWLEQVSAMLDTALADEGFETPVTESTVTPELDMLVNGIVVDLVAYSHKTGRYYTTKNLDGSISPFIAIDKEVHEWVKRKTLGLRNKGCSMLSDTVGRSTARLDLL